MDRPALSVSIPEGERRASVFDIISSYSETPKLVKVEQRVSFQASRAAPQRIPLPDRGPSPLQVNLDTSPQKDHDTVIFGPWTPSPAATKRAFVKVDASFPPSCSVDSMINIEFEDGSVWVDEFGRLNPHLGEKGEGFKRNWLAAAEKAEGTGRTLAQTALSAVPAALLCAVIVLLMVALLSPVAAGTTSLFTLRNLQTNETLLLGPIGSCIVGLREDSRCSPTSLTPAFASAYDDFRLPPPLKAEDLVFSFPLLPTLLLCAIALFSLALGLVGFITFPQRTATTNIAAKRKTRLQLRIAAVVVLVIAFCVGFPATVAQRISLEEVASEFTALYAKKDVQVDVGRSFVLLWIGWAAVPVAATMLAFSSSLL